MISAPHLKNTLDTHHLTLATATLHAIKREAYGNLTTYMKVLRLEQIQEEKIPTVFLLLPCNEDDSELSAADGKFYAQNS